MSLISKIRGITGNILAIGIGGPNIKNNNNVFEMRNANDDGYASLRVGDPVGNNDVITKQYLDNNSLTGSSFVIDDNGNTVSDANYAALSSLTHASQTSSHSIIGYNDRLSNITSLTSEDVGKVIRNNNTFQIINTITPTWLQFYSLWSDVFGTGIDGNLTLSGSTVVTFTKDMYYNTVTIPSGITGGIVTNGFQLFCNILDLRGAPAGSVKIKSNYNGSGSVAVTGITSGTVCGGISGVTGGAVSNGVGGSATSLANFYVNGGNGGNGGNVASGAGGGTAVNGGSGGISLLGLALVPDNNSPLISIKGNVVTGYIYGGQAGGGGSASSGGGATGGASGAGAGVMRIFARNIITDGYTAAGAINIAGGNGGNGGDSSGLYSGSGGGGGGGGYLEIWYESRIGSAVTNLINASGGAGGSGFNDYYTVGNGGNSGGQGTVILCNIYSGITRYRGSITSILGSGITGTSINTYNVSF